jgi:hypothetical protein
MRTRGGFESSRRGLDITGGNSAAGSTGIFLIGHLVMLQVNTNHDHDDTAGGSGPFAQPIEARFKEDPYDNRKDSAPENVVAAPGNEDSTEERSGTQPSDKVNEESTCEDVVISY